MTVPTTCLSSMRESRSYFSYSFHYCSYSSVRQMVTKVVSPQDNQDWQMIKKQKENIWKVVSPAQKLPALGLRTGYFVNTVIQHVQLGPNVVHIYFMPFFFYLTKHWCCQLLDYSTKKAVKMIARVLKITLWFQSSDSPPRNWMDRAWQWGLCSHDKILADFLFNLTTCKKSFVFDDHCPFTVSDQAERWRQEAIEFDYLSRSA